MRVKYWIPYEAQPHITSDLGEASKLVQAKQATLESVEHEKPGKRIIVQMTYLNDIGGIETAMANMSKKDFDMFIKAVRLQRRAIACRGRMYAGA